MNIKPFSFKERNLKNFKNSWARLERKDNPNLFDYYLYREHKGVTFALQITFKFSELERYKNPRAYIAARLAKEIYLYKLRPR